MAPNAPFWSLSAGSNRPACPPYPSATGFVSRNPRPPYACGAEGLSGGVTWDLEIDARGHHCPVPTLKLGKALGPAPSGTRVRLIADDPMARVDVPHFCTQSGHELVSASEQDGGAWAFIVRKRA